VSKREDERFEAWKAEIRDKLPEDQRAAFEALADSEVAREELFRGTIRQKDYYTRLNELTLIKERDMLRAQLEELGTDNPPEAGSPISTEELAALKAKIDEAEKLNKILPGVLSDQMAIAIDAVKNDFKVDPREVMKLSLQHGVAPYKAYEHLTASQRSERYQKAREEEKEKWKEEGRREAITSGNGSPDHISQTGPSVVDYLREDHKELDSQDRIAAAVARFENKDY
jgi:hypothetical protein